MTDRQKLVETAVKFLQNPNIKEKSLEQRKSFLTSKGLTGEEIEEAVKKSGIEETLSTTDHRTSISSPPVFVPNTWSKLKTVATFAVIIGGGACILNKLYQDYIKPVVMPSTEDESTGTSSELNRSMQETLATVNDTLSLVQTTVQRQSQIDALRELLAQYSSQSSSGNDKSPSNQILVDIKNEITSLKGLMLNRHQFPPTPKSKPTLPTWQLDSVDETANQNSHLLLKSDIQLHNCSDELNYLDSSLVSDGSVAKSYDTADVSENSVPIN